MGQRIRRVDSHRWDKRKLDEVKKTLERFSQTRVLVVGDIMADEFIWGKVNRISPEAPVPVVNVTEETIRLGGAANVVNNIVSLGGEAIICGVIGNDAMGKKLKRELRRIGVEVEGIVKEDKRPTTVKTRVIAHGQQIVRYDREKKTPILQESYERIISFIKRRINDVNAVIISDYGKGVITEALIKEILYLTRTNGKIIAVDPKIYNFHMYRNVTVITPNHYEAGSAAGMEINSEDDLIIAGNKIIEKLRCKSLLITRGEEGMSLFIDRKIIHIPAVAREVYDVTGAGDTVISAFTLCISAGADFIDGAFISNFAAGIVVGKVGTATASRKELMKVLEDYFSRNRFFNYRVEK